MAKGGKRSGAGRPPGVPNKVTREVREVAQKYTTKAIHELARMAGLIEGKPAAESEQVRKAALDSVLDRGCGKPAQAIIGDAENPVEAVVHIVTGVPREKA